MGLLNRQTPLERKRRKLERELLTIQDDLRSAAGRTNEASGLPDTAAPVAAGGVAAVGAGEGVRQDKEQRVVRERSRRIEDDRFARYFANSFERVRPLRHERRIQRNKAILMSTFVILLLVWAVLRFLR